jgi:hypothetical protein
VLAWLDSSTDGLTGAEAAARLARDGPNSIRTLWHLAEADSGRASTVGCDATNR